MPSYMLRGLPPGLVARAKSMARAHETDLDAVLLAFLESYAENGPKGSKGGQTRAERLTPEQREDIARKAAQTRWSAPTHHPGCTDSGCHPECKADE